jgi:hypothetical protein
MISREAVILKMIIARGLSLNISRIQQTYKISTRNAGGAAISRIKTTKRLAAAKQRVVSRGVFFTMP